MTNHIALIFFLSILLTPFISFSQAQNNLVNIVFPSENQITVSELRPVTAQELREIQNKIELPNDEGCLYLLSIKIAEKSIEQLADGFKKYDISGDGVDDLILSGPCASEVMKNHFWVKANKLYYYVGLIPGFLQKFYKIPDSKPLSVVTESVYPSGSSINLFAPALTDGKLRYTLKKQVAGRDSLTIPEKRMYEKKFIVKNDQYNLRESPVINDKYDAGASDYERIAVYGNTLAKFANGSKGIALAEKTDDTGRVWWFVIMDENAKTDYDRFFGDENAAKMGWMSSRFLEVIK